MENKNPTQCDRLLDYMLDHDDGVTQVEALNELGILRLASRISEMRNNGHLISKDIVTVRNRYGERCHIARYRLAVNNDE